MALKYITGKLTDSFVGTGGTLTVTLSQPALIAGTQEVVNSPGQIVVAADGTYTFQAQANADLTPASTYYGGEEIGKAGGQYIFTFQVPQTTDSGGHAGTLGDPFRMANLIVVAPAALLGGTNATINPAGDVAARSFTASTGSGSYTPDPLVQPGTAYAAAGLDPRTSLRTMAALGRQWPGIAGLPVLMVSPPTVTLSAANAATSVAGSALRSVNPSGTYVPNLVTVSGGPISAFPLYPNGITAKWTEEISTCSAIEFMTDSPKFEIVINGHGQKYRVLVNGQLVTAQAQTGPPVDTNQYRILVDFSAVRAMRTIRCEFVTVMDRFNGIQLLPTDTLIAAPRRGPRVIVIGDSFGEGVGATDATTGWVQSLSWITGWDCWPLCEGGTGYLAANGGLGYTKAAGHLADATGNAPDLVLWALGINDTANTGAQIQAEATADYAVVRAALPGVPQIVLGPFWGSQGGGPLLNTTTWVKARDAIKAAAAAAGLPFADPMGTGYLYGTGHVGAVTGDGPADFLVSSADTTHPSQAGHDALARMVASTIAAVLAG